MSNSLNRLFRCRKGVAAVEFAVSLPFLVALVVGMTEIGRALMQANAIEKGLRAGAMYVARAPLPIDSTSTAAIENLVKRGTVDTAAPYLVEGWADAGASVGVRRLPDFPLDGASVPVFRVTARVPFTPLLHGFTVFTITRSHEQAYVGR